MANPWQTLGALVLAATVSWASGCGDSGDHGEASGGNGGSSSGGTSSGGSSASGGDASTVLDGSGSDVFGTNEQGQVTCGGEPCACDNGIDDDNDGLTDGMDEECTGPFDNDESTFATGIPGDNKDFCQDCFFDGNSGHGDDGCQYHTVCLYGEEPPGGGSECFSCDVTQACVDFCRARTPNGCDCFGCCEIGTTEGGDPLFVYLQNTCSLEVIDDETKCPRCVQSTQCNNECGRCELCPGKTEADIPADCAPDGGTPYVCEGGSVCGDTEPCETNEYCHLGCCYPKAF